MTDRTEGNPFDKNSFRSKFQFKNNERLKQKNFEEDGIDMNNSSSEEDDKTDEENSENADFEDFTSDNENTAGIKPR